VAGVIVLVVLLIVIFCVCNSRAKRRQRDQQVVGVSFNPSAAEAPQTQEMVPSGTSYEAPPSSSSAMFTPVDSFQQPP